MASSSNKWTHFGKTLKKMDDPLSCLKLVQISEFLITEVIKLSCEFIGVDITPGVREQLNMKLLLYSERYEGVPMAYGNVRCSNGRFVHDIPYLFYDMTCDLIVFQPSVGQQIRGVVNKLAQNHIGLTIHGHFNAALNTSASNHPVQIGDEVVFMITELHSHHGVLSIKGHLDT